MSDSDKRNNKTQSTSDKKDSVTNNTKDKKVFENVKINIIKKYISSNNSRIDNVENNDLRADENIILDNVTFLTERRKQIKNYLLRTDIIRTITFVLLVVTVICIAYLVYLRAQNIEMSNLSLKDIFLNSVIGEGVHKKIAEIKYDQKEITAFKVCNEYIIKSNGQAVTGFDRSGREVFRIPVSMNNPVIKTSGDFAVVADCGGREICVIKGRNKIWGKKASNNIINFDISKEGYVVCIDEAKNYRSALTVYDPKGFDIFQSGKGERFVVGAKISPSSKFVAVNLVDTSGVYANSIIEYMSIVKDYGKVTASITKENIIFPSVWNFSNDYFVAVSDNSINCFDEKAAEAWALKFVGKIYSSNILDGEYLVIALNDSINGVADNYRSEVKVINAKGKEVGNYKLKGQIRNINTYSDLIAINTGRDVSIIDKNGDFIWQFSLKKDIIDVYFLFSDRLAVVERDCVEIIRIKSR